MSAGWNFTIDDSSSFITYKPFEDGGLGNRTLVGWEPYWSGSGGFPTAFANGASGQSLHVTALDGASLSFQFYGNAVYLHGTTNGTIDVTVDNSNTYTNQPAMGDGILYSADNLATQTHYVTLTAHFTSAGQVLEFDLANVTYAFKQGSPNMPLETVYDNTNASAFQYTGTWSIASAADVPSPTSTAPYHITSQYGSSVSMNFTGEAVAVYGFRDWGNWIYDVSLDGYKSQYNGSTPWQQGNSLLFFQAGLDPNQTHTIVLTDEADQTYWQLMLNSVTVFQPSVTESHGGSITTSSSATGSISSSPIPSAQVHITKSDNTGAIAGGVIGGVVVLVLVGCLLLWLARRYRFKKADISPSPIFPVSGSSSSNLLKTGSTRNADPDTLVDTPPVTPGMYHKGAPMGRPLSRQIPLSPPVTVLSSNPPSSTEPQPPTVTDVPAAPLSGSGPLAGITVAPSASSAAPPNVTVDHIIELIARRIDRRSSRGPQEDDAPPRYPESVIQ